MDIALLPNLLNQQKPFDLRINQHGVVRSFYQYEYRVRDYNKFCFKVAMMNGMWACVSDLYTSQAGYGIPMGSHDFRHYSLKDAVLSECNRMLRYIDANDCPQDLRSKLVKYISEWELMSDNTLFKEFKFIADGV